MTRRTWTAAERRLFGRLNTPMKIQLYLNRLSYDPEPGTRSPRWVIREGKANCFEGALFAAAALRGLGFFPLVVDLWAANDDDHVLAVFRSAGRWGAVAKSNFTTLRFREPVYRPLRELVMSYFDFYFNTLGDKSLRAYSRPLNLARFDRDDWMMTDKDVSWIGDVLDSRPHIPLLSPSRARKLEPVDRDVFQAGMLKAVKAGLFQARRGKA
jgi:hypothetical protein